jgi:rhamnosyltransferase
MDNPQVSVLLLTHNGAHTLPGVLAAIKSQDVAFLVELVAVDSGSRDGTLDLLRAQADSLIEIREADFNHGTTRNLGVEACRSPLVVLLAQDAEPASPSWLARLTAPLLATGPGVFTGGSEPGVLAGTYARQVARPGASAVTRAYLARYAASALAPRVQSLDGPETLNALSPIDRLAACTFDNVCSCIRRSVWQEYPFKTTPIAEDVEWSKSVLLAGYHLAYIPDAVVMHSHDRTARYELRRTYLVHQQLRRLLGLATVPTRLRLARAIGVSLLAHLRWTLGGPAGAASKLAQLPQAFALAMALPLGQYLGAKSADTGRELLRARGV